MICARFLNKQKVTRRSVFRAETINCVKLARLGSAVSGHVRRRTVVWPLMYTHTHTHTHTHTYSQTMSCGVMSLWGNGVRTEWSYGVALVG